MKTMMPVLLAALALAAGTTACEEKQKDENPILGYWKLEEMIDPDGSSIKADEGTGNGDALLRIYHFQEDGMMTGYEHYEYDGDVLEYASASYVYEPDGNSLIIYVEERGTVLGISIDGSTMVLEQVAGDGSTFKFIYEKITEKQFDRLTEGFEKKEY